MLDLHDRVSNRVIIPINKGSNNSQSTLFISKLLRAGIFMEWLFLWIHAHIP